MKIDIVGAGAWGTALAIHLAREPGRHEVRLHARDGAQAADMVRTRVNARYLDGVGLPAALRVGHLAADADLASTLRSSELIVLAGPTAALPSWLPALAGLGLSVPVVWVCKGFLDGEGGELAHEYAARVAAPLAVGVLSGPSFAQEVAAGKPCALVAASAHERVRQALVEAFHSRSLRVYPSADVPGVEVGGAVKNVLAIACGLCDGLDLGLNARAALITRGLAEAARLGVALGAQAETFMGLSGLGDLVLTATGDLSRNRRVGLLLAQGRTLDDVLAALGHVAEGVRSVQSVLIRARRLRVEMPIAEAVLDLVQQCTTPAAVVEQLMGRAARSDERV